MPDIDPEAVGSSFADNPLENLPVSAEVYVIHDVRRARLLLIAPEHEDQVLEANRPAEVEVSRLFVTPRHFRQYLGQGDVCRTIHDQAQCALLSVRQEQDHRLTERSTYARVRHEKDSLFGLHFRDTLGLLRVMPEERTIDSENLHTESQDAQRRAAEQVGEEGGNTLLGRGSPA